MGDEIFTAKAYLYFEYALLRSNTAVGLQGGKNWKKKGNQLITHAYMHTLPRNINYIIYILPLEF